MSAPLIVVDRLLSVEAERAAGVRNVPGTLAVFDSHFPLNPVLPGVLVLGSLGELARVLLVERTGERWRLAGAARVRYRHFIRPGDQMEIEVKMKEFGAELAVLTGKVEVDGRTVTSAGALRMERVGRAVPA